MKNRELRYDVDYLAADGTKRGREPCTVTVDSDGQRTIRARSEIFDTEIVRDVTYTVGADFRPIDCFIRVRQWDAVIGSTWFRFDGATAECEGFTVNEGRISQRLDLAKRPESLHHPRRRHRRVALHQHPEGPGTRPSTHRPDPELFASGQRRVRAHARTMVRYAGMDGSLWLQMWCTNDPDRVMLRMYYSVYDSGYVLAGLLRDPG